VSFGYLAHLLLKVLVEGLGEKYSNFCDFLPITYIGGCEVMKRAVAIALAVASIWFSLSFRGGKVTFKVLGIENALPPNVVATVSEAKTETPEEGETVFG
jgi:hypothetical protein